MNHTVPIYLMETLTVFFEERNLVRTAKRLQTTQPTVTRQLSLLQSYYKEPLFKTLGREKRLTDFGSAIAAEANAKFNELDKNLEAISRHYGQADQMTIRLGGRREFIEPFIASKNFDCNIEVLYLPSENVISNLLADSIDVGITHKSMVGADYIGKPLFTDAAVIVIPKKFSPTKPSLNHWLKICEEYPIATYSRDMSFFRDLQKALNIKLNVRGNFFVSDWQLIEKRIQAQTAWGLLPKSFARPSKDYHVLELSQLPENIFTFYLYFRKDLRKYGWFQDFLNLFKNE